MLRLWVTLYYGYWMFFVGLTSLSGCRGQGPTPTFEVPSTVWWRGSSITFVKYRNDGGNCQSIAVPSSQSNANTINGYSDFNQNGAWFGGADKITFKMDGTSCVRVSTHRGEWVQMYFPGGGSSGCSVASTSGGMVELRFFDHPECRLNEWRNVVNPYEVGPVHLDTTCFNDRGSSPYTVYYRAFCDVSLNITTTNVYPTTTVYPTPPPSLPVSSALTPLITDIVAQTTAGNETKLKEVITEVVAKEVAPILLAALFSLGQKNDGNVSNYSRINAQANQSPPPEQESSSSTPALSPVAIGLLFVAGGYCWLFLIYVLFCISTLFAIASASFFCSSKTLPYFPVR